jgi:hypothetical protein
MTLVRVFFKGLYESDSVVINLEVMSAGVLL